MRAIINENILPIVTIAKENMITNVMKNSELQYTREDIKDVWEKLRDFERTLDIIPRVELKFSEIESRFN